jgi:outer membrane lipoprotein SlyB
METNSRLQPLLTAAAISVIVFSAVGVGTLTGLVPHSIGSQKEAIELPKEVIAPVEPAIGHVPAKKAPVARPAKPRPSAPIAYSDFGQEPRLAQAETPGPVVQPGHLATVQAVREVKDPGQHTGFGPIAGGIAGAVIGDQLGGKGNTRKLLTVLGAAGGAYAGREIERQARATQHWEIDLRRDDGAYDTLRSEVALPYNAGDRVRVVDGRLQPV